MFSLDNTMFSVGNIVTLLSVVIILFSFRYFDQKNRTLAKVKRYANHVVKNSIKEINQNISSTQDLIIELQVGIKAGTAMLKQVHNVGESLAAKKVELETMDSELRRHRTIIDDMGAKTTGVEKRLHSMETKFEQLSEVEGDVDKIHKVTVELERKISEATKAVTDFDRRVGDLLGKNIKIEELETGLIQALQFGDEAQSKLVQLTAQYNRIDTLEDSIEKLEKKHKRLNPKMTAASKSVKDLAHRVQTITVGAERAKEVLDAMPEIEQTLEDVELRAERLQVVREWLASAETRLETININAKEQIRLLEALLAEDRSIDLNNNGAQALTKRDIVLKLSKQDWSVEHIARATKLSRGEIELIMEIGVSTTS